MQDDETELRLREERKRQIKENLRELAIEAMD